MHYDNDGNQRKTYMSDRFVTDTMGKANTEFDISLRPGRFADFVGQAKVRERLELFVQAATGRRPEDGPGGRREPEGAGFGRGHRAPGIGGLNPYRLDEAVPSCLP